MAQVLGLVVNSGDNYGLQAVVAELERSGRYADAYDEVKQSEGPDRDSLLAALKVARSRLSFQQPATKAEIAKAGVA
jgi:hypothetical protein